MKYQSNASGERYGREGKYVSKIKKIYYNIDIAMTLNVVESERKNRSLTKLIIATNNDRNLIIHFQ
jgi:transcriptional regulator of met regulon